MAIVFQSRKMKELLERANRFAKSSAVVLIHGESGTGKELLARAIHDLSSVSNQAYMQLNCAALSDQLIESELFGHEAGAFTGATQARKGRLEDVGAGTLFLDEVGELPIGTQAKFLRVLEEREFQRVGSNQTLTVHGRIVAATNRDLGREVLNGKFREDLFHRLNVLSLELPPLRERRDDIPLLVSFFLRKFRNAGESNVEKVSAAVLRELCEHDWPGNIRQLRNTLLKSCLLSQGEEITDLELQTHCQPSEGQSEFPVQFLKLPLDEIERQVILQRISHAKGNKTAAAETLGVTCRTLRNKIERYRKLGYVA